MPATSTARSGPARTDQETQGECESTTARLYLAASRLLRSVRRPDPAGLGNGSLSALATLAASGATRLGDLAAAEQVAAPTMTRLVTSLVETGHAQIEPDPTDRRARLVHVTSKGQRIVTGRHTASISELRHRYEQLTPAEQASLRSAVPVLETLVAPMPVPGGSDDEMPPKDTPGS